MEEGLRKLPLELREPWEKPPDPNTRGVWVFLHADVIDHSRLFTEHMGSDELLRNHAALQAFRSAVEESIPHFNEVMEWDWAGDGGIFAFPDTKPELETTRRVLMVAELIRVRIRQDNELREAALRFQVRLVITRGSALYYRDKEVRCGSALNLAAKLRIPGERTSIIVTKSVLGELRDQGLKGQLRPMEPIESFGEPVYVYVPALRDALLEALDEEAESGDKMQAAHLAYRLGVLEFGTGDGDGAIQHFERAGVLLGQVEHRHRYYFRTLAAFYRLWHEIAIAVPSQRLTKGDRNDRREFLRELAKDPELKAKFGTRWQFLHEMEFCIEQLDILARHPVVDPTGLTTMQMCLMLERFGYPRRWHGSAIEKRINRINDELTGTRTDRNRKYPIDTMDKGCSLCTAVAASCLMLDSEVRHEEEENFHDPGPMVTWLISLKSSRFSFRTSCCGSRVAGNEHALHYAASVLQALVDYDSRPEDIRDVVDVFFKHAIFDDQLPVEWVKYLHIPYFDLACYVFSAFARAICA